MAIRRPRLLAASSRGGATGTLGFEGWVIGSPAPSTRNSKAALWGSGAGAAHFEAAPTPVDADPCATR